MKKKVLGPAIVFLILALPTSTYFFLKYQSDQHFDKLEIVGRDLVENSDGSYDTLFHNIYDTYPDFNFTDQNGNTVTWDDYKGHIFVADVFFTRCPGMCPKLSSAMERIHDYYKDLPELKFLSISVDPENDSVPALRDYATKYGAEDGRWHMITGDKAELYKLAHEAFFFRAMEDENGELGFVHDDKLMLVDKEGHIRKGEEFYSGLDGNDVQRLIDEIRLLKLSYEQTE